MQHNQHNKVKHKRGVSLAQAARLLRRNTSTLRGWIAAGCPAIQKADRARGIEWRLDLREVLEWQLKAQRRELDERHRAEVAGLRQELDSLRRGESTLSADRALDRERAARARLLELELGQREGSLIPFDDVVKTWVDRITACKRRLRAIPAAAVTRGRLTSKQGRMLLAMIDEALDELAGDGLPPGTKRPGAAT